MKVGRLIGVISGSLLALAPMGGTGSSVSAGAPSIVPAGCNAIPATGFARCFGLRQNRSTGSPRGYNPGDLQSAYGLTTAASTKGGGETVAIVDAFDDPNAVADVSVYRSTLGGGACGTVSVSGCTFANGATISKIDQRGGTAYPRANRGWSEEISLDLDMVSAICPRCNILLVEADSNSFANLADAVDEAAGHAGVVAISNSYGGGEYASEVSDESHFDHPGIAVTVSAGDSGYGAEFPAASQYVTAVGGTTLSKSRTGTFSETVWNGTGSGCSSYISQPSWQTALTVIKSSSCGNRVIGDVAADADPNTGVSVYDTFHQTGWLVFGGTSVSSPIIASVYALAGNTASIDDGSYSYSHTSSLHDITSGSNGSCGGTYLCTAETGYDGPTGNGTPSGTGGF